MFGYFNEIQSAKIISCQIRNIDIPCLLTIWKYRYSETMIQIF